MNKKLKSILSWLLAPSAIGIYITLILTAFCFLFYAARDAGVRDRTWVNLLMKMHQSAVDLQFQIRGPQKGAEQVALLVVDEKAVASIGRWPWPREVLAKTIDNAVHYGAKVLAFDMVFSEPSNNVAQQIYDKLHSTSALSPQADQLLQTQVHELDGDHALADVYGRCADHIVAGTFYEG